MATVDEMVAGARTFLRDYPQYFEVDEGPLNVLTVRLPHPLIARESLQVYLTDPAAQPPTTALTTEWQLDERNGLLKLTNTAALGDQVLVAGYYYTWFSDSDLQFHIEQVLHEFTYNGSISATSMSPIIAETIEMGGVVHALWSLATELSLDIDVSTPEGMFIPARQRYTQVLQMMQYWENEY